MSKNPWVGSYVSKIAKSVLVCIKCKSQVEICGFTKQGLVRYKCVNDLCPSFDRERNLQQREWIEIEQSFFYLTTKVI